MSAFAQVWHKGQNNVTKVVTIAMTVVTRVTFWWTFQSVVEKYSVFAIASAYEMAAIVVISLLGGFKALTESFTPAELLAKPLPG